MADAYVQMLQTVQDLFVTILIIGELADRPSLRTTHKIAVAEDLLHNARVSMHNSTLPIADVHQAQALAYVQGKLMKYTKTTSTSPSQSDVHK